MTSLTNTSVNTSIARTIDIPGQSRQSALGFLGEATVAPVTSTIRDIPSEVALTTADGVPRDCAVNLDHLQTVPAARIGALIATLPSNRMAQVTSALLFALGFDR